MLNSLENNGWKCLCLGGGGIANAFFHFFLHLKEAVFFCIFCVFFCIFFASVLPSVSFYCGNPWTNLCHMPHFDKGGGMQKRLFAFFFCIPFFAVSICILTPPPPPGLWRGYSAQPTKPFDAPDPEITNIPPKVAKYGVPFGSVRRCTDVLSGQLPLAASASPPPESATGYEVDEVGEQRGFVVGFANGPCARGIGTTKRRLFGVKGSTRAPPPPFRAVLEKPENFFC